jgi:NO-binding membrane sensor protein with MHYT domain
MHFIGNRAIILGDGSNSIQIAYNVPFTLISLLLPILVLLIAFYAISFEEKATFWRLIVGGLLTGSAVCAMHYVGQLGVANYHCKNDAGNIVGAAIIATFSATLALGIFFRWKAAWMDSWWRRLLCACLLAGAVTGMHWTAAVGTTYMYNPGYVGQGSQLSRNQTVIICAALVCVIPDFIEDD